MVRTVIDPQIWLTHSAAEVTRRRTPGISCTAASIQAEARADRLLLVGVTSRNWVGQTAIFLAKSRCGVAAPAPAVLTEIFSAPSDCDAVEAQNLASIALCTGVENTHR
jgi:hypothetical protein